MKDHMDVELRCSYKRRPEKRDLNAIGKHEICRGLLSRAEDSPLPALVTPNTHRPVFLGQNYFFTESLDTERIIR